MKLFALFLFFISVFIYTPVTVSAQDSGWIIDNYAADITLLKDGEVDVVEQLEVNFRNLEKHGIYRDIPFVYEDENGEKTYTEIIVEEVFQDGREAEYELLEENGYIRIKIGDPNETISKKHVYEISYSVRGVLRSFEDHDELYWNVIGPYWEVPIEKASATVRSQKGGLKKVDCFVGTLGSTFHCESRLVSDSQAEFQTVRSLNPYEGFTIVVGYEKGLYPFITVERPKTLIEKFFEWPSLITLISVAVFGIVSVFFVWLSGGRDYWNNQIFVKNIHQKGTVKPIGGHETVVVEYSPPEKLPPAVLGVLADETAHTHDVTATIIDLATRGYLTITEVPKKWLFGNTDYTLTLKKDSFDNLYAYEKLLLTELFESGNSVTVSSLKKSFYDSLKKVKDELYKEVTDRNLFPKNPDSVRSMYLVIAIFVIIAGIFVTFFSIDSGNIYLADISIGTAISGLVLLIFSRFMPRRTAYGRELYRRVKGYELFISNVEKHRQKFFENKNMFNDVLPYAIVFGLTKKFSDAMKEMGIEPAKSTTWYHGVTPMNSHVFASHVNGFSESFGSAIASTPSSSGGFSGGSSGGGFGGGGGGSW